MRMPSLPFLGWLFVWAVAISTALSLVGIHGLPAYIAAGFLGACSALLSPWRGF